MESVSGGVVTVIICLREILKYCSQPIYAKVQKNRVAWAPRLPVAVLQSPSEVTAAVDVD